MDAQASVKQQAFYMHKGIESDNLKEALTCASSLLGELRTGKLQPQRYFELYMQVFDHMALLQSWFREQGSKKNNLAELYERVQWAGNVLPRLYLLCTVGACYIRSKQAPAKDMLRDMVEMCKGVQHPTRGLFLRAYLCQAVRGLLPDVGSEYASESGGNTRDAIEFLLQNFAEMNKLWVRMQHQSKAGGADQRTSDRDRQQLADLVGKNLTYLSQLDGLDFELYSAVVLPRVTQQIIGCRDALTQQYLMQALIQGFSDEFHLGTLEALLATIPQLQPGVRLAALMASLMERLAKFVGSGNQPTGQSKNQEVAFAALQSAAADVVAAHPDMAVAEVASMHIGLARFAEAVFEDHIVHFDGVLGACARALQGRDISETRGENKILEFLTVVVESCDTAAVLQLENLPVLMRLLAPPARRTMALAIVHTAIKRGTLISTVDETEILLNFIEPLIRDSDGLPPELQADLSDEQSQVARLVHLLSSPDPKQQYAILQTARKRFKAGGPLRAAHILPPLAAACLKLVRSMCEDTSSNPDSPKVEEVLQFLHAILVDLADLPGETQAALGMLLLAAVAASQEAHSELLAYDFFEQAFELYEEAIPDSRSEVAALYAIVGALIACRIFDSDNRAALAHKATGFSAKLLKRGDQCRAILACSHLYWQPLDQSAVSAPSPSSGKSNEAAEEESPPESGTSTALHPPVRDAEGVMVLLKRALKLASSAQQQVAATARSANLSRPVWLYVDILNEYALYFKDNNSQVTRQVLQNVLELVEGEISSGSCQTDSALLRYYTLSAEAARKLTSESQSLFDEREVNVK